MRGLGLVLLAACQGEGSDSGDTAEQADEPSASAANSGLVWVDADGNEVPGVAYVDGELGYFDADGFVWNLDPYSGELSGTRIDLAYADDDCTTELASRPPPPRHVVTTDDGRTLGIADDAEILDPDSVYVLSGGVCSAIGSNDSFTPIASMLPAEQPSATWTPPLHPEIR